MSESAIMDSKASIVPRELPPMKADSLANDSVSGALVAVGFGSDVDSVR